jgi:hypothetical protein
MLYCVECGKVNPHQVAYFEIKRCGERNRIIAYGKFGKILGMVGMSVFATEEEARRSML